MIDYPHKQTECCNPVGLHSKANTGSQPPLKKKRVSSSLFEINCTWRDKTKSLGLLLIPGQKICIKCKIDLSQKLRNNSPESQDKLEEHPSSSCPDNKAESSPSVHSSQPLLLTPPVEDTQAHQDAGDKPFVEGIEGLNIWLQSMGFSPISERNFLKNPSYEGKVWKKLEDALAKFVPKKDGDNSSYFKEMVDKLRDFVKNNKESSKKILALSVLPQSWSYKKIEETMAVSNRLARKSRALVKEHGILSAPQPKKSSTLPETTVELVKAFYLRDDISRVLPGKKDYVSVKENGVRVHKSKRLVLSTLLSLYKKFQEENPNNYLSSGRFCELQPRECVLAGRAGTHVICVCT